MEIKTFPIAHLKALGADEPGTFEAIVSVFGNTDAYGDRVYNGAFVDDLAKGFPPVVWTHSWGTVPIGVTKEMYELDRTELVRLVGDDLAPEITGGLYGKGALMVDDHEVARQCYAAMKTLGGDGQPALREFSFAYDILTGGWETEDGDEHYALRKLATIEWGPCLKGVNDSTRLIAVKGDERQDGRERPPRPSEISTKADPPANPPEGGEEPAAGAAHRKAYLDLRYAVPRH